MKLKFCYVSHCGEISPQDRVFQVWVGVGKRDQVKRALIESYAEDCGAYFRIWDEDTDYELEQRVKSFISGSKVFHLGSQVVSCSISQLYKAIIDGNLSQIQPHHNVVRTCYRQICCLFPAVPLSSHGKSDRETAKPVTRKDLKPTEGFSLQSAVISFCLILAMFIIGAILEGIERAHYIY